MMRLNSKKLLMTMAMLSATTFGGIAINGNPAHAAYDDYFVIYARSNVPMEDNCPENMFPETGHEGMAQFIDYGEGAPGGGNNDDYVLLRDTCPNGDGVKAWAWLDGKLMGEQYLGAGAGYEVVWDPFGNVKPNQKIGLKICSVNGNKGTPYHCQSAERKSVDG